MAEPSDDKNSGDDLEDEYLEIDAAHVEEELDDLVAGDYRSITVYSRDWTVDTIVRQIEVGNIDLNPHFQRRNVWDDGRKSRLIESLIVGIPIPNLVFAESSAKRRSFVVIDGKQRLLSIAGYTNPTLKSWHRARLSKLGTRADLNGITYAEMAASHPDDFRSFSNADIRCTVIANYQNDALYEIFSRLNTGSVPLSTQELRQVLFSGHFADYLFRITEQRQPIQDVLKSHGPDKRLVDIEIILRFMAVCLFADRYKGNLKRFLDEAMATINSEWPSFEQEVGRLYDRLNSGILLLGSVMPLDQVGRKVTKGHFESRFNRVLFEVQVFYAAYLSDALSSDHARTLLADRFAQFCSTNQTFRDTLEATTKTLERYYLRFELFQNMLNATLGTSLDVNPFRFVRTN